MKVEKITYQKAFWIGPYLQEKVGMEVVLEEGDTPDAAISFARETIDQWNNEHSPLPEETVPEKPVEINIDNERLSVHLQNANTLEELAQYKFACTTKETIKHYMDRLKELTK